MRISDWSSDVCSSDLGEGNARPLSKASLAGRPRRRCRHRADKEGGCTTLLLTCGPGCRTSPPRSTCGTDHADGPNLSAGEECDAVRARASQRAAAGILAPDRTRLGEGQKV